MNVSAFEEADHLIGGNITQHIHLTGRPADLEPVDEGAVAQSEMSHHLVLDETPAAEDFPSLHQITHGGNQAGAYAESPQEIAELVLTWIQSDQHTRQKIRRNAARLAKPKASLAMATQIHDLL